jgi:hypothetical protein
MLRMPASIDSSIKLVVCCGMVPSLGGSAASLRARWMGSKEFALRAACLPVNVAEDLAGRGDQGEGLLRLEHLLAPRAYLRICRVVS